MTALVRILTTSTLDSSPAILLIAPDGSKILVNCGEGNQRAFLNNSQRLSTVHTVCLTHLAPEAIGGLPGTILTSADAVASSTADKALRKAGSIPDGKPVDPNDRLPSLVVVGPQGTRSFFKSLRHFMYREQFHIRFHEGEVEGLAPRKRERPFAKSKKGKDVPAELAFAFSIQSLAFSESSDSPPDVPPAGKRPRTESHRHSTQHMSYIFSTNPLPGKFLPDKAAALGIPKGPLYAQLKSGKTVTFTVSGTEHTVESSQVMAPGSPGVAVAVLWYPSRSIAEQLVRSEALHKILNSEDTHLDIVIHVAPRDLFVEFGPTYWEEQGWHVQEGHLPEHVFVESGDGFSRGHGGSPFRSAALGAKTRSLLCPEVYARPEPGRHLEPLRLDVRFHVGCPMMEYTLVPRSKRGFGTSYVVQTDEEQEIEASQVVHSTGALELATQIRNNVKSSSVVDTSEGELIFTGTGSALPCKHRNVSGIYLKQPDGRSMLLDVGEGTIGQLLRAHGSNKSPRTILENIKVVWLSHPHADHHLGLLTLLHLRQASDQIVLIAPLPILRFLEEYAAAVDPSIADSYVWIDCRDLKQGSIKYQEQIEKALGITSCHTVPVTHCSHAFAVILQGTAFGTVVYSGDCRPSSSLAAAAEGADLLIHEATFEDGMEAEAVLKRHSTVGEALTVAAQMKARCVVLTHFSQRYPKIPPTAKHEGDRPIVFAFDYMRLTPQSLQLAAQLTPAVRLLYPVDTAEDAPTESSQVAAAAMSIPGFFADSTLVNSHR